MGNRETHLNQSTPGIPSPNRTTQRFSRYPFIVPGSPQSIMGAQSIFGNQTVGNLLRQGTVIPPAQGSRLGIPPLTIGTPTAPTAGTLPSPYNFTYSDYIRTFGDAQVVYRWLSNNRAQVSLAPTVTAVITQLEKAHPDEIAKFDPTYLGQLIVSWANDNKVPVLFAPVSAPKTSSSGPSLGLGKLQKAAQNALKLGPVQMGQYNGKVSLWSDGLTAQLTQDKDKVSATAGPKGAKLKAESGKTSVSGEIKWKGDIAFSITQGDYTFSASVTEKKWAVSLQFGQGSLPTADAIKDIFDKANKALGKSVQGVLSGEINKDKITGEFGALKKAVSTAQKIQKASKTQFGVKLEVFGPGSKPDEAATAKGTGAMINFFIRF